MRATFSRGNEWYIIWTLFPKCRYINPLKHSFLQTNSMDISLISNRELRLPWESHIVVTVVLLPVVCV
jgi:hypothetical protein